MILVLSASPHCYPCLLAIQEITIIRVNPIQGTAMTSYLVEERAWNAIDIIASRITECALVSVTGASVRVSISLDNCRDNGIHYGGLYFIIEE